jgi:hypothetical protein
MRVKLLMPVKLVAAAVQADAVLTALPHIPSIGFIALSLILHPTSTVLHRQPLFNPSHRQNASLANLTLQVGGNTHKGETRLDLSKAQGVEGERTFTVTWPPE